jgi:hypothetical protein
MRTQGVKLLDPVAETRQTDWMVLSTRECPDHTAEERVAALHFRRPHEPWGSERAFVQPVTVRRSSRRVLFIQDSGLGQ